MNTLAEPARPIVRQATVRRFDRRLFVALVLAAAAGAAAIVPYQLAAAPEGSFGRSASTRCSERSPVGST